VTNQGYINAESVCALLRSVTAQGVRVPITLVLDNARYQRCGLVQDLAAALRIELLYLPSYSPNRNLIERLWRFLCKRVLDARYYEEFDQFMAGIDQGLDELTTKYKGEMSSLLTYDFQLFEDVPILAA
jgi:transposase